jgi:hypothetical protein
MDVNGVVCHSPEEERQGRSRAGDWEASEETRWCWSACLARQREKRTRVPESAMAVAASARPAWEPPSAADEEEEDDMPTVIAVSAPGSSGEAAGG